MVLYLYCVFSYNGGTGACVVVRLVCKTAASTARKRTNPRHAGPAQDRTVSRWLDHALRGWIRAVPASRAIVQLEENAMAAAIPEYTLFVGIDIAAKSFTALIHTTTLVSTERPFTLDQTAQGFAAVQQRVAATA